MEISSGKVLDKMSELVLQAKKANSKAALEGYVMAIQALCDVLSEADRPNPTESYVSAQQETVSVYREPIQQAPIVTSMPQTKPIKIDKANGDSLFDF